MSARCGNLLRRLIACIAAELGPPMSNVVRSAFQAASQELIAKLIKAGYLQPALRHDADAITAAIARLKQDLRERWGDDESLQPLERLEQTSLANKSGDHKVARTELQCRSTLWLTLQSR
jgi:hypothetical protein